MVSILSIFFHILTPDYTDSIHSVSMVHIQKKPIKCADVFVPASGETR